MADLEDIVQRVIVEGSGEAGSAFVEMAEVATVSFNAIRAAAIAANSALGLIGIAIGAFVAVVGTASYLLEKFAANQAHATTSLAALGDAFGTSAAGAEAFRSSLTEAGVSIGLAERFMVRAASTIARSWASIERAHREAGVKAEEADERIKDAALGVESAQDKVQESALGLAEAQNAAQNASTDWALTLRSDALSVAQAWEKLKFTAADLASEAANDLLSVQGASISLQRAQYNLYRAAGGRRDASRERELKLQEAQQAVAQAEQRLKDSQLKQTKDQSGAPLKQREAELSYQRALQKAKEDEEKSSIAVAKANLNLEKAHTQVARAALDLEKAFTAVKASANAKTEQDLHDLDNIKNWIANGNEAMLRQVSPEEIKKAIVDSARGPGGQEPTAAEFTQKLADALQTVSTNMGQQIIQSIGGGRVGGADNAKLYEAVKSGASDGLKSIEKIISEGDKDKRNVQPEAVAAAKEYEKMQGAIATANEQIKLNLGRLAFEAGGVAERLGQVQTKLYEFVNAMPKPPGGGGGGHWQGGLITAGRSLGNVASGANYRGGRGIPGFASGGEAWAGPVASVETIIQFGDLVGRASQIIKEGVDRGFAAGREHEKHVAKMNAQQKADGGAIHGPGSGTSDSILARLSNGEFVVRAAAVRAYGVDLFHSLNNMAFPGFAMGGPATPRYASGGPAGPQPSSVLNLTIDGQRFEGLRAPEHTAEKLRAFAIGRQTASAGRLPSWVK